MNTTSISAGTISSKKSGSGVVTKVFLGMVFLLGFIIRFIQYISEPTMWKDELFSVVNIESMSMYELITQQPAYNQVAGVGFYVIQKTVYLLTGELSTEMVFRFYPFIASLLTMWLFYLIAKKFLRGTKLVMATFLIATSLGPFFQSFNAKPYAGDIMFIMFFIWIMLTLNERLLKKWEFWVYGLVGFIGATASLPSVVISFIAALLLGWKAYKIGTLQKLAPMLLFWVVGIICNMLYLKFGIVSEVSSAMAEHHTGNLPPTDGLWAYLSFFPTRLLVVLGEFVMIGMDPLSPLVLIKSILMVLLSATLIIFLFKRKKQDLFILFIPIICMIGLVAVHVLPMMGRTAFYGLWPFILLPFIALSYLQDTIGWVKSWLSNGIAIVLVLPSILIVVLGISTLPIVVEPVKKVLTEYKQNRQEGDVLYVHGAGDLYMQYYAPKMGVDEYILGKHYADVSRETYSSDLEQLKGNKRVWFYFVGYRPEMNPELTYEDIKAICEEKGALVNEQFMGGAYANFLNLYDFSEK